MKPVLKTTYRSLKGIVLTATATVLFSCGSHPKNFDNALDYALSSPSKKIKRVMDNLEAHELQILLTTVERDLTENLVFLEHSFQLDSLHYFYPASTVKFPAAVLSLEKLTELNRSHLDHYMVEGDTSMYNFAATINKIFAVSDNEANNRLFEFLGSDYINSKLKSKGIHPLRISHRLSTSDAANPTTKSIDLRSNGNNTLTIHSNTNNTPRPLKLNHLNKGIGYIQDGLPIDTPFDFSYKNYFSLNAQHEMIKRVIFPEAFKASERFLISEEKRNFLLESMHKLPREQGYDPKTYYDSYGKFLWFGDTKKQLPKHIKIYNKVGYAYGTLTDCAFIEDRKNNLSYFVTATILVNQNGIFNDNNYEYDSIGIPFLAELGRQIHKYEKYRKKHLRTSMSKGQ